MAKQLLSITTALTFRLCAIRKGNARAHSVCVLEIGKNTRTCYKFGVPIRVGLQHTGLPRGNILLRQAGRDVVEITIVKRAPLAMQHCARKAWTALCVQSFPLVRPNVLQGAVLQVHVEPVSTGLWQSLVGTVQFTGTGLPEAADKEEQQQAVFGQGREPDGFADTGRAAASLLFTTGRTPGPRHEHPQYQGQDVTKGQANSSLEDPKPSQGCDQMGQRDPLTFIPTLFTFVLSRQIDQANITNTNSVIYAKYNSIIIINIQSMGNIEIIIKHDVLVMHLNVNVSICAIRVLFSFIDQHTLETLVNACIHLFWVVQSR